MGISGGKDSSATLSKALELRGDVSAFTLRSGYYPDHIEERGKTVARAAGVEHLVYDFRDDIRPIDRECYTDLIDLYDGPDAADGRERFRQQYVESRKHYSVRCDHRVAFVRVCQLCRRSVIRAYYKLANDLGAAFVFLGMNEWTGLSGSVSGSGSHASAVRRLQPTPDDAPVWIVHIPFLYQWTLGDTRAKLDAIGWEAPEGEALVESNSNSCLLARATEAKARDLLGFSPDTSRLAREVTAGFLSREEASRALSKAPAPSTSVREVLSLANLA